MVTGIVVVALHGYIFFGCTLAIKTLVVPIRMKIPNNIHQRLDGRRRLRLIPVLNQLTGRGERRAVAEPLKIQLIKTLGELFGRLLPALP